MNLIVVGCGRVGSELAQSVAARGHRVVVIDRNPRAFLRLADDFVGQTIQGDVLDLEVLHRARVEAADGFAAVTPDDATNLIAARSARDRFNVPNVVARVYDPSHDPVFTRAGLQTVISSSWSARRIEQLLTHPGVVQLASLGNGEVVVAEVRVAGGLVGSTVAALGTRGGCHPAALVRAGQASLPSPDTELREGDLVVVTIPADAISRVQDLLGQEA